MAAAKPTIAHTAARVAAQEGPDAGDALVRRSALRWWLVALAGSGAAVGLTFADGLKAGALAGAGGPLLMAVLLGVPRAAPSVAVARLAQVMGAAALGALGAAGDLLAAGFALTFAGSWAGGESVALAATLLHRRPLAIAAVIAPAVVSSVLVYAVPALTGPLGAGSGAMAAVVLLALARVGEHAAPYRHAADQLDAAAATRLLEPGRALWLALTPGALPEQLSPDQLPPHQPPPHQPQGASS